MGKTCTALMTVYLRPVLQALQLRTQVAPPVINLEPGSGWHRWGLALLAAYVAQLSNVTTS